MFRKLTAVRYHSLPAEDYLPAFTTINGLPAELPGGRFDAEWVKVDNVCYSIDSKASTVTSFQTGITYDLKQPATDQLNNFQLRKFWRGGKHMGKSYFELKCKFEQDGALHTIKAMARIIMQFEIKMRKEVTLSGEVDEEQRAPAEVEHRAHALAPASDTPVIQSNAHAASSNPAKATIKKEQKAATSDVLKTELSNSIENKDEEGPPKKTVRPIKNEPKATIKKEQKAATSDVLKTELSNSMENKDEEGPPKKAVRPIKNEPKATIKKEQKAATSDVLKTELSNSMENKDEEGPPKKAVRPIKNEPKATIKKEQKAATSDVLKTELSNSMENKDEEGPPKKAVRPIKNEPKATIKKEQKAATSDVLKTELSNSMENKDEEGPPKKAVRPTKDELKAKAAATAAASTVKPAPSWKGGISVGEKPAAKPSGSKKKKNDDEEEEADLKLKKKVLADGNEGDGTAAESKMEGDSRAPLSTFKVEDFAGVTCFVETAINIQSSLASAKKEGNNHRIEFFGHLNQWLEQKSTNTAFMDQFWDDHIVEAVGMFEAFMEKMKSVSERTQIYKNAVGAFLRKIRQSFPLN